jgi:outer membrane protein assembly factor BamD (BamD/ComL family)
MGNLIKRGFGKQKAGKTYKKWTTFVKAIPYGGYVTVKLRIKRRFPQNDHTTVVVEEPIPTGGFVLPSSIKTYKAHAQVMPGKILFTLPKRHNQWIIQYRIYGARPGSYNIPGTSVRSFVKPDFRATGQPHRLTVLAKGSKQHPTYKLTPDELYVIGMTYYNAKKWKLARKYLTQLDNQFVLRRYYQNKVAKALLQLVLKDKQHPLLIKYFERVKEQSPSLVLPFSQIVKVGEAYAKQKEYERSSMIFAAILQAHFLHDLKIAAALEKQGEFKAAARFTEELCKQYPDFKAIQEAMYGLAQTAFQQASRKRKKPKQFKQWLARAERLFRQFITMYPTHPSVDVAAYSRANVIMEQKRRNHAIAYLGTIGERYQDSKELDSMHYLRAYGLYLTRKNRDALELLQYVSTADYTTSNGKLGKSKHQYLARYLIAQLYHANAEWQKALSWYSKVKTKFSDAKAQVEHFKKKQLRIPEVTVVGTKDKATIALTHQNIKAITLLAYRVDLVKLYLQKKNLRNVTRINLAGIQPTYRRKHTLGNGMEFQSKTTKLTLPLQKRGAYLIVLKAREREVSGILLRTRLKLKVHEQQASGRVTVHLLGRTNQRPFADTTVRVIGSGHKTIHTGSTDLRGIFSVENVRGTTTILAQRGDDFAFYRGTLDLQWSKRPKPPRAQQRRYGRYNWRRRRRRQRRRPSKRIAPSMLEHINKGNTSNILRGRSGMLKLYKKSQRGVQMDSLF